MKQKTKTMMNTKTYTYNERNFYTISKEEWQDIANQIASYLSDGYITSVEYCGEYLRPQDAALIECENIGTVPLHFYKLTWMEWQIWIKVKPSLG